MATVRISTDIRSAVDSRILNMFGSRLAEHSKKFEPYVTNLWKEALDGIPKAEWDLVKQLELTSRNWFKKTDGFNIKMTFIVDGKPYSHIFNSKAPREVVVPYSAFSSRSYYNTDAALALPATAPSYEALKQLLIEQYALNAERDQLRGSISKILDSCSTLRQVLEVWPTALDFMPESVIEKHNRKDAPRTLAKIREEVVVDDATKAALLKARMLNGGN